MPRPRSIRLFEGLQLAAVGLGWIAAVVEWQDLTRKVSPGFALLFLGTASVLVLSLTFGVSRVRSTGCRWMLTGLTIFSLLSAILFADAMAALDWAATAASLGAMAAMWRPDATSWITGRWKP